MSTPSRSWAGSAVRTAPLGENAIAPSFASLGGENTGFFQDLHLLSARHGEGLPPRDSVIIRLVATTANWPIIDLLRQIAVPARPKR